MPYSRFQPLSPNSASGPFTLHRLRTAFSSPSSSRPSSTGTMSPLSPPRTSMDCSPAPSCNASLFSATSETSTSSSSSAARLRQMIMLRHRPSTLELGLEEERRQFAGVVGVLEPRPATLGFASTSLFGSIVPEKPVVASIFEVMEGMA